MQNSHFKQSKNIFLSLGICLFSHANAVEPRAIEPVTAERFAPGDLQQNGKISLTPGFAPDGKTMYFAQSECSPIWECPQRMKRSRLSKFGWSTPELVSATLNGRVDYPSVSADGRYLLFSWAIDRPRHKNRDVYEDFDLYRIDLSNPNAKPEPLDEPDINRIRGGKIAKLRYVHNETAPVITRNGDLYFWTERLDGVGERDIYTAPSDGNGGFQTARALPAPINSTGRDTGWIGASGNIMLLSYEDRGGSGGSDLFVSYRKGSVWTGPVNLGASVNSAASDFAGTITPDNKYLVFSSTRAFASQAEGLIQIWQVPLSKIPQLQQYVQSVRPSGVSIAPCVGRSSSKNAPMRRMRMLDFCD